MFSKTLYGDIPSMSDMGHGRYDGFGEACFEGGDDLDGTGSGGSFGTGYHNGSGSGVNYGKGYGNTNPYQSILSGSTIYKADGGGEEGSGDGWIHLNGANYSLGENLKFFNH